MWTAILPAILAVLAGVGLAVQAPTNAALGRASGSVILAALISFGIGSVILATIWLVAQRGAGIPGLRNAPAWSWVGGVYGAYFVAAVAFVAPRIGLGAMLTLMIAGQLLAALILDHYGLLGLPRQAINATKLAGLALVLAGVVIFRRG